MVQGQQVVSAGDCTQAVHLCSDSGFTVLPNGHGAIQELIPGTVSNPIVNPGSSNAGCLLYGERNTTWAKIFVYSNGTLEFALGSPGPIRCYDWILYRYNPNVCNDILGNLAVPLRCNWNTPCNGYSGMSTILPTGGLPGNFEPPLQVACGDTFLICFSNFDSLQSVIPIRFFGTAGVSCTPFQISYNPNPARLCERDSIDLTFNGATTFQFIQPPGFPTYRICSPNQDSIRVSPGAPITYTVIGTTNCFTDTILVPVHVDSLPIINTTVNYMSRCDSCNGSISIDTTFPGPGQPYTYLWIHYPDSGMQMNALCANEYMIEVTSSAGCRSLFNYPMFSNAEVRFTITWTPPICTGNQGTATVVFDTSFVFTGPYTLTWSTNPVQTTLTATGLTAGMIYATIYHGSCYSIRGVWLPSTGAVSSTAQVTNPTCHNGADGQITLNPVGGSPPYSYYWTTNPIQTTQTATGLTHGTYYTGRVTDSNGCIFNNHRILTNPPPLQILAAISPITCHGAGDGSITLQGIHNGIQPYSYTWNTQPVTTVISRTGLSAGTYPVLAVDSLGCSVSFPFVLADPPRNIAQVSILPATCISISDGSAQILLTPSPVPYDFTWNTQPVQTTSFVSGLQAGSYSVHVISRTGCADSTVVVVPALDPIQFSLSQTHLSCFGQNNGNAVFTVGGNNPPFNYLWSTSPNDTLVSITGLSAGTYSFSVWDSIGCFKDTVIQINSPPFLNKNIAELIESCADSIVYRSLTIQVSGGTPGYQYSWNTQPVRTTQTISGLTSGTYTCTLTDANGCVDSVSYILNPIPNLNSALTALSPTCHGFSNGSAQVVSTGGIGNYTYLWNTNPPQTGISILNLPAGNYSVRTQDSIGCTRWDSIWITAPGQLQIQDTVVSPVCHNGINGSVTIQVSGGTSPYLYSWSTNPVQTTLHATGLGAGTYTLQVTDHQGCVLSSTYSLINPLPLIQSITSTPVSCLTAPDGGVGVTPHPSPQNLSYVWNTQPPASTAWVNGLSAGTYSVLVSSNLGCQDSGVALVTPGSSFQTGSTLTHVACADSLTGVASLLVTGRNPPFQYSWNTQPVQTASTAIGLGAGTYTCVVTDTMNCQDSIAVVIIQPPSVTLSTSVTDVLCFGQPTGTMSVAIQGGTPGYGYSWNTQPPQYTAMVSGVRAGIWQYTITDTAGCRYSGNVLISESPAIQNSISVTNPACSYSADGQITANLQGGIQPYSYQWNTQPVQSSQTATGLSAGSYILEVRDSANCVFRDTIILQAPAALQIQSSFQPVSCYGLYDGWIRTSVTGGTGGYSYSWNNQLPDTSSSISQLNAGTYLLEVQDSFGCIARDTFQIVMPDSISLLSQVTPVVCHGQSNGSAVVLVSGGTGNYSYLWNSVPPQMTAQLNNVTAGSYSLVVLDSVGCRDSVQVFISQPSSMQLTTSTVSESCPGQNNGGLTVFASGGTVGYQYTWNTVPPQSTTQITGLSPGTYRVWVTDANGCSDSILASVNPGDSVTIAGNISHPSCFQYTDGKVSLNLTGGIQPYQIVWQTSPSQHSQTATGLGAGIWGVTVTDGAGCLSQAYFTVTNPAILSGTAVGIDITCSGNQNGQGIIQVAGGTPPYAYLWNCIPIQTSPTANGLPAGSYSVQVADAMGCTLMDTIQIVEPVPLTVADAVVHPVCHGDTTGAIQVLVQGGIPPYQYLWNTGGQASSVNGLQAGTYSLLVVDSRGCQYAYQRQLNEPPPIQVLVTGTSLTCAPSENTGTAQVIITNAVSPVSFTWNNGLYPNQYSLTGLSEGTWSVWVMDGNNCRAGGSYVVQGRTLPVVTAGLDASACAGQGGVGIGANASGGVPPYIYTWFPQNGSLSNIHAANPNANPDSTTIYSVFVTDDAGCVSEMDSIQVIIHPLPVADAGLDLNYCSESPGVFLLGSATNGSGNYRYHWSPSANVFCDTCPVTYANPPVSTMFTLLVTDLVTGCSSDSTNLNTLCTMVLTVVPRPTVAAGPDTLICEGDTALLCGSVTGAGPLYSWAWSPSLNVANPSSQCTPASPPHSTWYFVVAESNGCESPADSLLVSVSLAPVVDAGVIQNICRGDSVRLNGTVQSGSGTAILWTPFTGLNDPTSLQPNASPDSSGYYFLQVSHQGCMSTGDSVWIEVHDYPELLPMQDTMICSNHHGLWIHTGLKYSGSQPVMIQWEPGSLSGDSLFVFPVKSTMYYIEASTGVSPALCVSSDSVLVTVVPGVELNSLTDTSVICPGQSVSVVLNAGIGNATFVWLPNAGVVSLNDSLFHLSPSVSTTYSVSASEGGCADTTSIEVKVHPDVEAEFTLSQPMGCLPVEIHTQNLSAHALNYTWSFGDGSPASNEANPSHLYSVQGSFAISLIARGVGGCMDTFQYPIPVSVSLPPQAEAYVNPKAPVELVLPMATIELVGKMDDSDRGFWHTGDGHQLECKTCPYTYHSPGVYYPEFRVESANGCFITIPTGPVVVIEPEIFIPNVFTPNQDGIQDVFRVEYNGDELFLLKIADRWGVTLFETHNSKEGWDGKTFSGTEVADGVYFYVVVIGQKSYSGNITVVR